LAGRVVARPIARRFPISPRARPVRPANTRCARVGCLAQNILATIHGEKKKPFRFKTPRSDGEHRARWVWRGIWIPILRVIAWWMCGRFTSANSGFEKKFRVALDWTLDLLFHKDLVQFQTMRR